MARPEKITCGEMRDMGVCGLLIYCSDYKCSHLITISGDRWPDNIATVQSRAAVCLLSLRQAWRGRPAKRLQDLQPLSEAPVASSILLADQIAVGVTEAAVVVATVVAVVIGTVSAVSGGAGCCGSYCCRPDCRSAIRIPSTVSSAAIGPSTVSGPAIGHATPRNSTASDTHGPSGVNTCTAATVGERVVGNKDCAEKCRGRQANESITQHW
jgi:hypothetical protein